MNDVNYNDNNRIVIQRENFEQIILNINNKDNKYTFVDLNDYILFLKIITNSDDKNLFKKVEDIKKEIKKTDLVFNIDKYYNDLNYINLYKYKAIKYYGDTKHKIITYCRNNEERNTNKLICKIKQKFINIELEENIEYDFIYFLLNDISITETSINTDLYDKNLCKKENDKLRKNMKIVKKVSLILGGTIGFAGLSVLLIPTIFGISALGPIAGGLFAYLQSIGITLSVIQSISMTGLTVTIGTCTLSGASMIILPGLIVKDSDIIKDQDLKKEIEIYINNKIN